MTLPGLRKADHIGFTVPDIEQAIDFFQRVLGSEEVYRFGPFAADDDWMKVHLNVDARAKIRQVALLNGPGINLELFEYTDDIPRNHRPPRNSDVGGYHIALYVDDMAAAVAWLKAEGIEVPAEPILKQDGPGAGESWVYFTAPWGLQLELVSYPGGKAYERDTPLRLFDPRQ